MREPTGRTESDNDEERHCILLTGGRTAALGYTDQQIPRLSTMGAIMAEDEESERGQPAWPPWAAAAPGRILNRGHPAGDFLEAYEWIVIERRSDFLELDVHLPDHVRNPRGQLFGGFTPTYVDLIALLTVRPQHPTEGGQRTWLATTNMRVDYFEPITGPRFRVASTLERRRGRTLFVATRFFQNDGLAVFALTTMRAMPLSQPLGDA
jgi:acyl-coenzyme A thioesterase PaaI-like protein